MMNFDFLLDIVIVILLVTTIAWCVVLNRRLRDLRKNQSELATLIAELNLATSRAENGITVLKTNAEEAGATLRTSIDQAERLNDDLAYLSERGSRLVERLDGPTKRSRQTSFANVNNPAGDAHKQSGQNSGRRKDRAKSTLDDGPSEFFGEEKPAKFELPDEMPELGAETSERRNLEKKLLNALRAAR
ncbi:MAG: DUF6468 domain-containing protein [Proteobacteria bacterium]|nr:DUF6468 domain-containing protein [Pseudomonadota bacterium]